MANDPGSGYNKKSIPSAGLLSATAILGIGVPVLGTLLLNHFIGDWTWPSLPFHSTIEVAGAILGLVLSFFILNSRVRTITTRRLWIACALASMAALDIFHSCVPAGNQFVWFHSIAVLASGLFLSLIWLPEKEISRPAAWSWAGLTVFISLIAGFYSVAYAENLPLMMIDGNFSKTAEAINLLPSLLVILAALNFGIHYYQSNESEELLFLLLCLLFGMSGVLFQLSGVWESSWWFWHVLRFCGYLFTFWLAMMLYRSAEIMVQEQSEQLQLNVQRISLAAEAIANGHLDVEVDSEGLSDLLAQSINRMTGTLKGIFKAAETIAAGNLDIEVKEQGERDLLAQSINRMTQALREASSKNAAQSWLKDGLAGLNQCMRGEQEILELGRSIITYLAKYLNAKIGAIYLVEGESSLRLAAGYAFQKRKGLKNVIDFGEGLVGQAALEGESILITDIPDDYLAIGSGLGESPPEQILVYPFLFENKVKGVIELGSLAEFSDLDFEFLSQSAENIAIGVTTASNRRLLRELLEQTQAQAGELQAREEELRNTNETLEKQARDLKQSERLLKEQQAELEETNEKLQVQQEELRVANEELREKTEELEKNAKTMTQQNKELDRARHEVERKAGDLELTSKYKSEFLANMSHELRTPLNSLLILSKLLVDNRNGNLDEKQVDFARTIYESGTDLLNLINEILDLSKIEAGKMDVSIENINLKKLLDNIRKSISPSVDKKGLNFNLELSESCPEKIQSDPQKLSQIVKNLLSNAVKFTEEGSVNLSVRLADPAVDLSRSGLDPGKTIVFTVSDTGIGIPDGYRQIVFEAFQQADGTIRRKYGGTGLGLSISRELAKLLGGEIQVKSAEGQGSEFSLYIPLKAETVNTIRPPEKQAPLIADVSNVPDMQTELKEAESPILTAAQIKRAEIIDDVRDDRRTTTTGDRSILIIEDDPKFAGILCDQARERGFKCLIAADGETGLHFADYYKPSGIILDISLPGIDGWAVMERLKENLKTRHIPVHFISAADGTFEAMKLGAVGYLTKPVSLENMQDAFIKIENIVDRPVKELLVIEDDDAIRTGILELIGNGDVKTTTAACGADAQTLLESKRYDCIILDLRLQDMFGGDLLETIRIDERNSDVPVIVFTGKDLTNEEVALLDKYAERIIVKGVRSPERLLDDTALFLHRVEDDLPEEKKRMIRMLHDRNALLKDKKILIVDDDMRNVYALTQVLEEKESRVVAAKNGRIGLERLDEHPETDIVLMDIMMPKMDGYEAMRKIREQKRFRELPIIALTAKAMKGDRAKCIEAGANDYLAKPVDPQKLLSMLNVWLYR